MMSTFPPLPSSDMFTGIPIPVFEGGFTPWDCHEPPFVFQQQDPIAPPEQTQNPVLLNSGSDNTNSNHTGSNSGSDEPNRYDSVTDERKRRRMISNRESARRSRMRKQKHLENLRNQLNRLKIGNRELMNRLRLVTHNSQILRADNDRLRSESVILQQKLWDIRQILLVRQLQQQLSYSTNFTCINEQIPPSLIT